MYAFDKSIVMALGAISTPLSGLLAEKVFGATTLSVHKPSHHGGEHAHAPAPAAAAYAAKEHANNLVNAHALENGLLTTLLIPLVLKLVIYTFLYCESLPLGSVQDWALIVLCWQACRLVHAVPASLWSQDCFAAVSKALVTMPEESFFTCRDPAT